MAPPASPGFRRGERNLSTSCFWEFDAEIPLIAQVAQDPFPRMTDTGVPAPESLPRVPMPGPSHYLFIQGNIKTFKHPQCM